MGGRDKGRREILTNLNSKSTRYRTSISSLVFSILVVFLEVVLS